MNRKFKTALDSKLGSERLRRENASELSNVIAESYKDGCGTNPAYYFEDDECETIDLFVESLTESNLWDMLPSLHHGVQYMQRGDGFQGFNFQGYANVTDQDWVGRGFVVGVVQTTNESESSITPVFLCGDGLLRVQVGIESIVSPTDIDINVTNQGKYIENYKNGETGCFVGHCSLPASDDFYITPGLYSEDSVSYQQKYEKMSLEEVLLVVAERIASGQRSVRF